MPFLILAVLFVAVPIIEITLLLRVGATIGVFNTIGFVILTAVIGAWLVRQQGFATIAKVRQQTFAGQLPAMPIAEGIALLLAGAVLLTPGFMTDAIGFALLVPTLRQALIRYLLNIKQFQDRTTQPRSATRDKDIIEGEVVKTNIEE